MRARLLDSARRLFAERGFEAVSVADITSDAGVTAAALYVHFANKRAIYDEILAPIGPEAILAALSKIPKETAREPAVFLRTLAEGAIATWASVQARTIMTLFTRELLRDISTAHSIFESIKSVIDALAPYFLQWKNDGLVRDDVDDGMLVWELFSPLIYIRFAYFQSSASRAHVTSGMDMATRHVEHFIETNLRDARRVRD